MSKVRSPHAKALEQKQFRRQVVPSGKQYDRKAEKFDGDAEDFDPSELEEGTGIK